MAVLNNSKSCLVFAPLFSQSFSHFLDIVVLKKKKYQSNMTIQTNHCYILLMYSYYNMANNSPLGFVEKEKPTDIHDLNAPGSL